MIRLRNARVRLDLAPAFGCRWMRFEVKSGARWTPLLLPVPSLSALRRDPFFDGAYLMAPWCNRIPKGRFTFRGTIHFLQPNFPDGSAIHGDALSRAWRITKKTATSMEATLESSDVDAFNFPWPISLRHGVRLTKSGATAWMSLTNAGAEPCPAALGFHPFFPRTINGETASLEIPPRRAAALAKNVFDEGLALRGKDVVLSYGAAGEIRLTPGTNATDLFAWTPKRFRGKAANFACVEPMTMKAGSFGKPGTGVLKPGETLRLGWAVTFSRSSATRS